MCVSSCIEIVVLLLSQNELLCEEHQRDVFSDVVKVHVIRLRYTLFRKVLTLQRACVLVWVSGRTCFYILFAPVCFI